MIPNNINLDSNKPLLKQLQHYQSKFKVWWERCGPVEFLDVPMNIRVPTGATSGNWSKYVKMRPSEYKWGVYVASNRYTEIQFGTHKGEAVWESVPADYYNDLFRHIRVQGDVENAGVEQG